MVQRRLRKYSNFVMNAFFHKGHVVKNKGGNSHLLNSAKGISLADTHTLRKVKLK